MSTILITGVSTGIGRASAELFRDRDWHVIGTVRDPARTGESFLGGITLEALDLSVPGSAVALGERVLAENGVPDVLLNNAGMLQLGSLEDISAEELMRLYQVNVFGQMELIRTLLPAMRERGYGTIANVTSIGGRMVFPFFAAYNSTKWALEGISEGLWHELKPFGIRVKAIEPGFVQTAIWDKALPRDDEEVPGSAPYRAYLQEMLRFEKSIKKRSTSRQTAEEIYAAIMDPGDRLRYPVSAYARPLSTARRWIGDERFIRFFHRMWMSLSKR